MRKFITPLLLILIPFLFMDCKKNDDDNKSANYGEMIVFVNDIPFKTNQNLRIPFMLKTWEWKKDGLSLRRIDVLNAVSDAVLVSLSGTSIPKIHMDPLPQNPIMAFDKISNYYFSIQVPVPLDSVPPAKISTRLVFRDTIRGEDVTLVGGVFEPRLGETPLVISAPHKGTNLTYINQSTNAYHFYTAIFLNGQVGTGERFAFDSFRLDDSFSLSYSGDSSDNTSYYCYHDTLYAVADGIVLFARDTLPENHGCIKTVTFSQPIDYAGNCMIIDIGGGHYAMYAHCSKNQIFVHAGDTVKEGQALALLGNSGNSDAPHLHFEIGDAPDFFMCNGVPFVLKKYTKIGEESNPTPPTDYYNVMMEELTVMKIE